MNQRPTITLAHRPELDGDKLTDRIETLLEVEARHILRTLQVLDGNKTAAARLLGVDRRTLHRKLARIETGAVERTVAAYRGFPVAVQEVDV